MIKVIFFIYIVQIKAFIFFFLEFNLPVCVKCLNQHIKYLLHIYIDFHKVHRKLK